MALTESTMKELGSALPAFALPDVVTGRMVSPEDYSDRKALLLMFICRHCPYVKHVEQELARLGRDYAERSLGIIAIASNDAVNYPDDAPESARRLALAEWIIRRDHPLTWRSIANRLWQYHIGRGLVDSPNDFGRMGQQPTHPELLDWLAAELGLGPGARAIHVEAMHYASGRPWQFEERWIFLETVPAESGPYMSLITALAAIPFTFFMSNDAFFFGILPVLNGAAGQYGIDPLHIARASVLGQPVHALSPLIAAPYLLAGLLKRDLGELQRYGLLWALGSSAVLILMALATGAIS